MGQVRTIGDGLVSVQALVPRRFAGGARSGLYQLGIREVSSLSGALVYLTAYVLLNPLRAFVTVNDPSGKAETLIQ